MQKLPHSVLFKMLLQGPDDDSFSLKDLYEEANTHIEEEVPIEEANNNSNEEEAAIEEEEPIKPKLTKWKRKTCVSI